VADFDAGVRVVIVVEPSSFGAVGRGLARSENVALLSS
jgi:hypothetical protein